MNHIQKYLERIITEHKTGRAREHSYRPAMKELLENINSNILATNEPARVQCGAPDFIITDKKNIPRGYIEAKDITSNILNDKKNQAQINKYFDGELGYNFIHTDNLEFRFYRNAELVETVIIAELQNNQIIVKQEQFEKLEMLLVNFLTFKTQTITSSKKLSEIMAGKARMIKRVIYMALMNNKDVKTEIHNQFDIFKNILVHDLNEESFADIYAQTITYGLFTARLHDPTLQNFDRDEAARLLPKSNPFLKRFFQSLRDDLDERIEWIVDDLIEIFLACDVKKLLEGYGKTTARNDPIIHFYEDFLASYDKKLRKSKGVYYTPAPVVDFIIRGVDHLLKTEFNLSDGIADTSKIEIEIDSQQVNKRTGKLKKTKKEVHKVQILDPATGTGTFLNEIVKYIYETRFEGMSGIWKSYVDENLLPRLHGFEIMMASYAMAHLKLDLTLQETGYKNENQERLGIYLTNSLEEHHEDAGTLFANWLSQESNEASYIKKNMPIMTIVGNPPYSVSSQNKGDFIMDLLKDYKKVLNERKINLDDDYIKFIRYSSSLIEKNGEGILAFITNNSYLDGITHRQMRKHLLETFDKIYIYDLHGNARKKETAPDGSIDQNVFDIMAGVNIVFAVKHKTKKKTLGKIYHFDSYGKRQEKYDRLNNSDFKDVKWNELEIKEPYYFFVPKDFGEDEKYNKGFSLSEIFIEKSSGIHTGKDHLVIDINKKELEKRILDVLEGDENEIRNKYNLIDTSGWTLDRFKTTDNDLKNYVKLNFRPFDNRWIIYENKALKRDRFNIMKHIFQKDNLGLVTIRRSRSNKEWNFVTSSKLMTTEPTTITSLDNNYFFPLYLYNEKQDNLLNEETPEKVPNLNGDIILKIEKELGMSFIYSVDDDYSDVKGDFFTPEDLFDYIYSVLHSKSYRETYKEFLKIDFPKVPFNVNKETFFKMVELGRELRSYHLMENENLIPKNFITKYSIDGDNLVEKIKYDDEKVFINDEQYFDGIPENVWNFYIGGYQPAQKWLKDRKGSNLGYEDIIHYGKMIVSLNETVRIMEEIEEVFEV